MTVELSGQESKALCKWAGVDLSQSCNDDGSPNPLLVAGAIRNVIRASEQLGPKLVAMLAVRGLIEPGETPVDALERLLDS
ncbi:hypothetical protein M0R72_01135 [Candidatus Pacearchaeota archaeon]|jgi:hypothetical protein|nr:hypothetical protein [Candidatus Pacearchaeota archaeon]